MSTELNAAVRDIPLPRSMSSLPVDERGFPVPWFVGSVDGKPDFRMIRPLGREIAQRRGLCWVCGKPLRRLMVSVIGPMCVVNKVTSEPPSHLECARYSAMACPFLSNPRMRRNEKNKVPEGFMPGIPIDRNPGVSALWVSIYPSRVFPDGYGDYLFQLPACERVEWYTHGRLATRQEAADSITSGLPALLKVAEEESPEAVTELRKMVVAAHRQLPHD